MSDRFNGFHVTLTKEGKSKPKPIRETIAWFALVLRVETTSDNDLLVVLSERRTSEGGVDGLTKAISQIQGVKDVTAIVEDPDTLLRSSKVIDKARDELLGIAKEFLDPAGPVEPTAAMVLELRLRQQVSQDILAAAYQLSGWDTAKKSSRALADQIIQTVRDLKR